MTHTQRNALRATVLVFAIYLIGNGMYRALHTPGIQETTEAFLEQHNIPGAVVGTVQRNGTTDINAFGAADDSTGRAMRQGDRFRLASLSKPVTSAAVLAQLAQTPGITLDTPFLAQMPQTPAPEDPRMRAITLRHLLDHSAGWDSSEAFDPFFLTVDDLRRVTAVTVGDMQNCQPIAHGMMKLSLQSDPGARYAYSNTGYCWLGLWLSHASGMSYEKAVKNLLPEASDLSLDAGAQTVSQYGTAQTEGIAALSPDVIGAAGGWIGSVEDYMPLATRPLDAAVFDKPQYAGEGQYYGLGWRIWPSEGGVLLTHFGALPGAFTVVIRTPDGRALVALFNGRPRDPQQAFDALFEVYSQLTLFR